MEKRNFSMFKELIMAEFKADEGLEGRERNFSVASSSESASAESGDSTGATADWKVFSEAPETIGQEHDYQEYIVSGANPGGIKPIKQENDAERCIVALDMFEPNDDRSLSVKVVDPHANVNDEVHLNTVKGSYATMKKNLGPEALFEGSHFFTVQQSENVFITYLDLNDDNNYGHLEYSDPRTFDIFRFSFLTRI